MFQAHGPRRHQRHIALGHLLVLDDSEATVELLFLGTESRGGSHCGSGCQKPTARGIYGAGVLSGTRLLCISRHSGHRYRSLLTLAQAIKAHHTATAVDRLVVDIDTVGLATFLTLMTTRTLRLVDTNAEKRMLADQSQQGTHRADCIAPQTAIQKTHHAHAAERGNSHPMHPARAVDIGDHAGVSAIWGHQRSDTAQAQQHQQHKDAKHRIAQPAVRLAIAIGTLLAKDDSVRPYQQILKDTHGTDHRAIEATKKEGDEQHKCHHTDIYRQDSRQQLHLRHPSQIMTQHTCSIQHQHRDAQEKQCSKNNSKKTKHSLLNWELERE